MKKSKFSDSQVMEVLKRVEAGLTVAAKPIAKARRKAARYHHYWLTATCIFSAGYGNGGT